MTKRKIGEYELRITWNGLSAWWMWHFERYKDWPLQKWVLFMGPIEVRRRKRGSWGEDGTVAEYKILFATDLTTLEKQVRDYLELGWVCAGGIAVKPPRDPAYATFYFQSMVREKKR